MNNSQENRETLYAANANYIKYLKLEYTILQQKTQMHWLKEGDANSKYFHSLIRGKRKRMSIHKILNDNGGWIQGDENIARETCEYYQGFFTGKKEKKMRICYNIFPSWLLKFSIYNLKECLLWKN